MLRSNKDTYQESRPLSDSTFYLFIHTNASSKDRVQLAQTKGVMGTNKVRNCYDAPLCYLLR